VPRATVIIFEFLIKFLNLLSALPGFVLLGGLAAVGINQVGTSAKEANEVGYIGAANR
jgi:hypothetical protein